MGGAGDRISGTELSAAWRARRKTMLSRTTTDSLHAGGPVFLSGQRARAHIHTRAHMSCGRTSGQNK